MDKSTQNEKKKKKKPSPPKRNEEKENINTSIRPIQSPMHVGMVLILDTETDG